VNRRAFFFTVPLLVAGCDRTRPKSTGPVLDAGEMAQQDKVRQELLLQLERYKVPPQAILTTPAAPVSVPEKVPALKALRKAAVRLHPRYSAPARQDDSKIGGLLLWPDQESWPVSTEQVTLAPVLQLRAEDAPKLFAFRPQTNLLQIFWNPTAKALLELNPKAYWRDIKEVTKPKTEPPKVIGYPAAIPLSCRLFPEQIDEYPPIGLIPDRILDDLSAVKDYDNLLGSCPGTKVGGYPFGQKKETSTACPTCKRPMDFLVSITGQDWSESTKSRWMPKEEQASPESPLAERAWREAIGLMWPRVNLFVCRRCEGWPVHIVA
jgi:hypothetical protein